MNLIEIDFSRLDEPEQRDKLDEACRLYGFFALRNHGISQALQTAFLSQQQSYFAQSIEEKLKQERTAANPFGFYNKELTKNQLDHKEVFDVSLSEETLWPNDDQFQDTVQAWSEACHKVALQLLAYVLRAMKADTTVVQALVQEEFLAHSSFLRLNYYPAVATGPDQFGVSHHTDAGALTLLLQDQIAGLQFRMDDQWHTAPASSEVLLVNLGDMVQVWSNDTYHAPLHRVLTNAKQNRFSAPYFLNPAYDSVIAPMSHRPRYKPVSWREFRSGRAAGDYADIGEEIQISQYRLES